nr:family 20 glycosylhydrolase [Sphingobacterium sp. IITKGP-BTPF85]
MAVRNSKISTSNIDRWDCSQTDPYAPAAYYTQADITEIVAYAQERNIEVIPEIDMPGHATAANRAYPQLSGGGNDKHPDFTFHPAKDITYSFLTQVLRETKALFPSSVIHIGGDEVSLAVRPGIQIPKCRI